MPFLVHPTKTYQISREGARASITGNVSNPVAGQFFTREQNLENVIRVFVDGMVAPGREFSRPMRAVDIALIFGQVVRQASLVDNSKVHKITPEDGKRIALALAESIVDDYSEVPAIEMEFNEQAQATLNQPPPGAERGDWSL